MKRISACQQKSHYRTSEVNGSAFAQEDDPCGKSEQQIECLNAPT